MRPRIATSLRTLAAASLSAGLLLCQPQGLQAQEFPDPSDTDALYKAAKEEGTLVWYTGSSLDVAQALAAAFSEKYPGISVEPLRLPGPKLYQRFNQEITGGRYTVDLMTISDKPSMIKLVEDGHVAKWKVPTADDIVEPARIGDSAYADHEATIAIVYNTNKVTQEEADLLGSDWKAILDPRFKGRFSVTNMKCGTCYAPIHMFLDPQYADRFGEEFMKAIAAQKPAVYSEILVSLDRVIAGEHDFAFWSFEGIAGVKYGEGAPIRWVFPAPTPSYSNTFSGISNYAPHPNAARLFLNWFTSEEGAHQIQKLYSSVSTLKGVSDTRSFVHEPWYQAPTEVYTPDFDRWKANFNADQDKWAEILKAAQ